jgi:hypothetical protein
MTTRVFTEYKTFKLVGDARGFTVSSSLRKEYWDWCWNNQIETEYQSSLNGLDLWYVKNEKDRMLAVLRWS